MCSFASGETFLYVHKVRESSECVKIFRMFNLPDCVTHTHPQEVRYTAFISNLLKAFPSHPRFAHNRRQRAFSEFLLETQ